MLFWLLCSYNVTEGKIMHADAVVRARIPADMKDQATSVLRRMGLSASDLIRLTFLRVAEEGRLPFALEVPNRTTRKAMADLEAGKGKRFDNAEALFKDLGI
jgi:DNA-damage-inducible protein J